MPGRTLRMSVGGIVRQLLPAKMIAGIKSAERVAQRKLRPVPWSDLRRLEPICRDFGCHRGQPIDRFYIEGFLAEHSEDIQGHVLEVGNSRYTHTYGGDRVTQSDVLHILPEATGATIICDLATGETIPQGVFDCFILTETLFAIFDFHSAIRNAVAALKPGGVLLVTTSGIAQVSQYDLKHWGDYWRFTSTSLRMLFEEFLPPEAIQVESRGNLLAATALLHGIAVEDLTREELEHHDPDYEVSVVARIVKPQ